jgi:phosphotransferase family enzyme
VRTPTALRVVHALDAGGLRSAGALPTVGGGRPASSAGAERRRPGRPAGGPPDRWPLQVPPDRVAERALAALPTGLDHPPVPLHSDPGGPTHVFTDEAGGFTGLIDVGDAYVAHPALDLRSASVRRTRSCSARPTSSGGPGRGVGGGLARRAGGSGTPSATRAAVGAVNAEDLAGVEVIRAGGRQRQFDTPFRRALRGRLRAGNRSVLSNAFYAPVLGVWPPPSPPCCCGSAAGTPSRRSVQRHRRPHRRAPPRHRSAGRPRPGHRRRPRRGAGLPTSC